jgi:predicted nuclease with RNAse H fold
MDGKGLKHLSEQSALPGVDVDQMDFIGIDFGAKAAGTTVICHRERGLFRFQRSEKGGDADAWLEERVSTIRPEEIYIDAPLSLPGVYLGKGEDHFFRLADRLAGGMSPMFLGGLTARAMRMAQQWRASGIRVHEVYPAALIRQEWDYLKLPSGKAIPRHKLRLMAGMFALQPPAPKDRHEADAWLCWLSGFRHRTGQARILGDQQEGSILV